jgi:hypothetical protein
MINSGTTDTDLSKIGSARLGVGIVKREGIDKINFLTIRHSCIFLAYKIKEYNSLYSLKI